MLGRKSCHRIVKWRLYVPKKEKLMKKTLLVRRGKSSNTSRYTVEDADQDLATAQLQNTRPNFIEPPIKHACKQKKTNLSHSTESMTITIKKIANGHPGRHISQPKRITFNKKKMGKGEVEATTPQLSKESRQQVKKSSSIPT